MDAQYEQLKGDVPNLKAKPSEYFREHFYFSTQPIEEPDDPRHLIQMYEMTGMTDRIMFSSDYPHWDFDSPLRALPVSTPKDLRDAIMGGNAARFYSLSEGADSATR
jgi:predicted TIM-barrel fold metal-dependent hydrolase